MNVMFSQVGDFNAMHAAEAWCEARGISVGRLQGGFPRGLLLGDFDVQKWRNLRQADKDALHGTMRGDMRHGPVTVWLDDVIALKLPSGTASDAAALRSTP
jgi:hypothetical protein